LILVDANLLLYASIENGTVLFTRDADFELFRGVRTVNPLAPEPQEY
jgi:predicted nucleic acid-binding protein